MPRWHKHDGLRLSVIAGLARRDRLDDAQPIIAALTMMLVEDGRLALDWRGGWRAPTVQARLNARATQGQGADTRRLAVDLAGQASASWLSPGVIVTFGEVGGPEGVPEIGAEDALGPAELTARSQTCVEVPFVSPVTVADVDVDTPSLNTVHDEPPFEENSTR